MKTSVPEIPLTTGDLSAEDLFLIERCDEAIRDGLQLFQWCGREDTGRTFFPIKLKKNFRLPNRAQGFFGFAEINGQRLSVMGTRQDIDFGPVPYPNAAQLIREFALGRFLPRANWKYPDGSAGGFTIEQGLYKTLAGEYCRFPDESRIGCVDWRDLGSRYAWALITIYINDFVMEFAGFRKRLREALCATLSPDFVRVEENPSAEHQLEVTIAYPVVRFAPIPNFFGFGPGKFQVAVKKFSFFLTRNNELNVRMEFASAPRCAKVLDFGERWPDPIYGGAKLLHRLHLLRNLQGVHDFLDGQMLAFHCVVHQSLIEGVETVWQNWAAAASR